MLHAGHFRKLHGLIEATVPPSAPFPRFLGGVLRVMDQQIGTTHQVHQMRINLIAMLDIYANDEDFAVSLKALDVVPVKVRERDDDLVLPVAHGAEVFAQISQSRARVNDGDAVRIGEHNLQTRGVAAELLKIRIANRDGSSRTVKFQPHGTVFGEANSLPREHQAMRLPALPPR